MNLAQLKVSDDPDLLAGLNATVAIEFDTSSTGVPPGPRGGSTRGPGEGRWKPLPGFEEVPCMIEGRGMAPPIGGVRPAGITVARVLFGMALPLDTRHRLRHEDESTGTTYWYLQGRVIDENQMGHHWWVDVQDQPL